MSKNAKQTRKKPQKLSLVDRKPLKDQAPSERSVSVRVPMPDRYIEHPGMGLKPRKIWSIFQEAEQGNPSRQCDLFEDILERDGHLRSQYESRIDEIVGQPWTLQAGGTNPEDIRAAEELEKALRAADYFDVAMEHQLDMPFYGWAASEISWGVRDGMVVPIRFRDVPHRRFIFTDLDEPRLRVEGNEEEGLPLEPGRWWFARRRGRRVTRSGLLRTAAWWSMFKSLAVRDWVVFSERYGLPFVSAQYDENASPEDKAVARQAAEALGKDGIAVFSKAIALVVQETKGGQTTDVQGALTALCNAEISKLISGATLTSETGGPGSFALGAVHQNTRFKLIQGDANRLKSSFVRDVAIPFLHYNSFSEGTRPPWLKNHIVRETMPEERAKVMALVKNDLGIDFDHRQVLEEFGLKPAPPGQVPTQPRKPAQENQPAE